MYSRRYLKFILCSSIALIALLAIRPIFVSLISAQSEPAPNLIRLAYFYKPPPSQEEQELVIDTSDTVILTRRDEWFRDEIVRKSDSDPILQYLLFERIHDPCGIAARGPGASCDCDERVNANNVGWNSDDVCMLINDHADWFLRNQDDDVFYLDDYVFMDIGKPGWQSFYLDRIRTSQLEFGWNGIFLDNVRGTINRFETLDQVVPAYPTDESYVVATEGFLKFLYETYFQPNDVPLYANLRSMPEENNEVWTAYLHYLDGAMDEFWAIDWGYEYLSPEEWELSMQRAIITQEMQNEFIAVTHGEPDDLERQRFALASFLLITDGTASFRYSNVRDYASPVIYDNFEYGLGAPISLRYREGENWRRDFENGYVTANPTTNEAEIIVR